MSENTAPPIETKEQTDKMEKELFEATRWLKSDINKLRSSVFSWAQYQITDQAFFFKFLEILDGLDELITSLPSQTMREYILDIRQSFVLK